MKVPTLESNSFPEVPEISIGVSLARAAPTTETSTVAGESAAVAWEAYVGLDPRSSACVQLALGGG